jgi:CubicO group peptidase (beta-lactamase class C family)
VVQQATAEFTVRDLLCHRSGLSAGAGDLMRSPDSTNFTFPEVLHNLRYFQPVSSFRSQYAYNNTLYQVAGELVARVAKQPWTTFVETRLLQPLDMRRSAASFARLPDPTNVAEAHALVEGRVQVLRRWVRSTPDPTGALSGAGGIYSSVAEMSHWVRMLLGGPGAPAPLLKPATQRELWTPQTLLPVSTWPMPYTTHFAAYGLGWRLNDVRGYQQVWHTGGNPGMVSQVTLLPELHLGIVVLTNQASQNAFTAVTNQIEDHYLGVSGRDRVQELLSPANALAAAEAQRTAAVWQQVAAAQQAAPEQPDQAPYRGRYHDAWFGDMSVYQQGAQLWVKAARSPRLVGQLLPYRGHTFVVRWNDRRITAAFAQFTLDAQGRATAIKLSNIAGPRNIFQDLDLQRAPETPPEK